MPLEAAPSGDRSDDVESAEYVLLSRIRSEQSGEVIPLGVSVGDTVVYSKYGGTEITVDGEDLLILAGRDILAIVQK